MANTPATKFVAINGVILNRDEVRTAYPYNWQEGLRETTGMKVEFVRGGFRLIEGVSPGGVIAALNGDPF